MKPSLRAKIAKLIKELREYRGLNVAQLARKLGKNPGRISALESGTRPVQGEEAVELGKVMEVRAAYILAQEDSSLPLAEAVRRQTLRLFLDDHPNISNHHKEFLWEITKDTLGADSIQELERLHAILIRYDEWLAQMKTTSDRAGSVTPLIQAGKLKRRRRAKPPGT